MEKTDRTSQARGRSMRNDPSLPQQSPLKGCPPMATVGKQGIQIWTREKSILGSLSLYIYIYVYIYMYICIYIYIHIYIYRYIAGPREQSLRNTVSNSGIGGAPASHFHNMIGSLVARPIVDLLLVAVTHKHPDTLWGLWQP